MPIIRRDESPDRLGPRILYLWNHKWWILIPAVAVFVLTYLVLLFVKPVYRVTSQVYVNRLAVFQDNEAQPATAATLLKSAAVLVQVRDAFVQKYPGTTAPLEDFMKQFTTKQEVLQDTTVQKVVSPVLLVSVETGGKDVARFLMDTWMQIAMQKFGNYSLDEARQRMEALSKQDAQLNEELRSAEGLQAKYLAELPMHEKMLAETLDLIAPSELRLPEGYSQRLGDSTDKGVSVNTRITQPRESDKTGALTQLAQVQLDSAWYQGTTQTAELARQSKVLEEFIRKTQVSAASLQTSVAETRRNLSAITREIDVKTREQRTLHVFMDQVAAVAATYREPRSQNPPIAGDMWVMAPSVTPEVKVWPKRTTSSAIAALVAAIIAIVALTLQQYARETAQVALNEKRFNSSPRA